MVNLFYLSGNTTGGWVTYTSHLMYGFNTCKRNCQLFKVGNNTENKTRKFGYGLDYRNLSLEDAVAMVKTGPTVIVALQKNFREKAQAVLEAGAWMVVHDPAEFANLKLTESDKYITIRRQVHNQIPSSTLILHPYSRRYKPNDAVLKTVGACSICRIDFDKNTHILLEANRLLPEANKIQIHGFENRLYTRFKLCPAFPEWEQSKAHYPREKEAAVNICRKAIYAVDMSLIKGDGGGTQYSFLEAMDGSCVNVIHKGWIKQGDEMVAAGPNQNCIAVADSKELVEVLKARNVELQQRIVENSNKLLARHEAGKIALQFSNVIHQ